MEGEEVELPTLGPTYTGITITLAIVNSSISIFLAIMIFSRRKLFPIRGLSPLLFTGVGFATAFMVSNLAVEVLQPEKCTQSLWFAYSNFAFLFFPYTIRCWKLFLQLHIASAQIQYLEAEDSLGRFYRWLLKHKRIASEPFLFLQWLIISSLFSFIPITILHLSQLDLYATEPRVPCQRAPEFIAITLFAAFFVVTITIIIVLIRRMPLRRDNFGIWQEVSRTGYIVIFFAILWFIFELFRRNITAFRLEDFFPRQWHLMFMFFSAYVLGAGTALYRSGPEAPFFFGYIHLFSQSGDVSGHSSRTLEDGEEIDVDLDRLKNNFQSLLDGEEGAALKKEFARFLAREFSQENILFWDQVEQLHEIPEEDHEEIEKKCRQIYKQYVARNSPLEVNLPNETALAIHNIVNVDQPTFDKNMYDDAQTVVFDLMKFDTFPRFLRVLDD